MVCCMLDISREFLWCFVGLIYPGSSYGMLYVLYIQGIHMVFYRFDISRKFIWCVVCLIYPGSSYDVLYV